MLLNLLATFDSVHHDILLGRLQTTYGLGAVVIDWVQVILEWLYSVRPFIDHQFIAVGSSVWSPTGFGPWTDSVPPVHCRLATASYSSLSSSSCLRRRHTDLWVLYSARH